MKKLRCPDAIKIGIQEFRIVQLNSKDDALLTDSSYGYTQDARNIIVIDRDLPESKKRTVVFHEILHAIRFVFETERPKKADYEEWEHYFIGIWENTIPLVLQANPEFTEWLLENDR
jgi:hypothetical protein